MPPVSDDEEVATATTATEDQPLLKQQKEDGDEGEIGNVDVSKATIRDDILDTIVLGAPIFVSMLSWVGMKTTDTALLGHVDPKALSAAALSDLWTMCTAVLIQGRALNIVVGGAVGAGNHKLASVYLQVSFAVLAPVAVIVIICWSLTGAIWSHTNTDPEIVSMAGYYAGVLSVSIPGQLIFSQISQFFSAQRIMHPEVNTSFMAMVVNLIFGIAFVLGIPGIQGSAESDSGNWFFQWIDRYTGLGFAACPVVTTSVVYLQLGVLVVVYMYWQKLHLPCWDGWSLEAITWPRIKTFSELYFPSAFGMASDFWRVAAIGTIAAQLGEDEVAVFNTSYRIMWIVLVLVVALSGASGINMTQRLGKMDPEGAKQAGYVGIAMATMVCLIVGLLAISHIEILGRIFSNDEVFLSLLDSAKWPFAVTLFFMNVAVAVEKIPYSMGRTNEVFWMGLIASWGAQVPAVYAFVNYWRYDLVGLYTGMAVGYLVLVLLYSAIAFTSDWKKYAEIARDRSEA